MEETGLKTKLKTATNIQEIHGTCPRCGGTLTLKERITVWKADGTPCEEETYSWPYCPKCKLFWIAEEE